jgi:hypothetical protein
LLLPFVVFVGWQAWLHGRFGAWPVATGGGNLLTWPFVGWFDGVRYATRLGAGGGLAPQVGTAMLPLMLAFGGALAVGVARSARLRSPFACIFLLLAALTFCFSWGVFALPRDLLRWSAIPLSLLPAALIKAPDAEASSPRVVTARVAS